MAPLSAVLDRDSFSERWKVYALRVPAKLCNGARKAIKENVLQIPRVLSVVKPTEQESEVSPHPIMLILLKYFAEEATSKYPTAPRGNLEDIFVQAKAHDVAKKLQCVSLAKKTETQVENFIRGVEAKDISIRDVKVEYLHWSIDAVLRALVPANVTIPSSFETIGHIAHLNLREEHAPYKKLIGEVMLDKLGPRIRSVVNKLQSTGGPYRTFKMEVLAGESDMETTVKESGCTFKLNFADVYWNSRLETEHRRIVQSLKKDDILADAFCGIGPFTVPASKQKRCKMVYANDLNPASVKYLNENVRLNKIDKSHISTSCSCARSFLRKLVQEDRVPITRVVMNFPAGAPEFLDVFRGLYNTWDGERPKMPLVHCYCFVKGVEDIDDARRRVRMALLATEEECADLPDDAVNIREVRDVAPRKRQVCVTFRVPESVAFSSKTVCERPLKKARTELVA